MAARIERPTFREGQILSAAQLGRVVEYGRDAQARHLRYLHSWGIAEGLVLTGRGLKTAAGDDYQEVTLGAGYAIDGSGREIVVAESERLSEDLFDQLNVATDDETAWYPVFLLGRDEERSAAATTTSGDCTTGGASALTEGFEVTFGRPGDEAELDQQTVPDVDQGPGGGVSSTGWRVLVGFVQWDADIGKFTAVADESGGIGRRYAGVRADEVVARGDTLELKGEEVEVDGDLRVTGKIIGALAGGVQVESGIVSDGMLVPLPAGITQEQVDDEEVLLQVHVTPHFEEIGLTAPAGERWLAAPIECYAEERRVRCRYHWRLTDGTDQVDLPGSCDYVVMAFPAE